MRAVAVIGLGVVCAITTAAPPASAAQKVGCPGADKWSLVTYQDAAQRIFEDANNNGFTSPQEVLELLVAKYNNNGNDTMCIYMKAERNSDTVWYYLRDDNSNGAS
jgi:hypothetical protein